MGLSSIVWVKAVQELHGFVAQTLLELLPHYKACFSSLQFKSKQVTSFALSKTYFDGGIIKARWVGAATLFSMSPLRSSGLVIERGVLHTAMKVRRSPKAFVGPAIPKFLRLTQGIPSCIITVCSERY